MRLSATHSMSAVWSCRRTHGARPAPADDTAEATARPRGNSRTTRCCVATTHTSEADPRAPTVGHSSPRSADAPSEAGSDTVNACVGFEPSRHTHRPGAIARPVSSVRPTALRGPHGRDTATRRVERYWRAWDAREAKGAGWTADGHGDADRPADGHEDADRLADGHEDAGNGSLRGLGLPATPWVSRCSLMRPSDHTRITASEAQLTRYPPAVDRAVMGSACDTSLRATRAWCHMTTAIDPSSPPAQAIDEDEKQTAVTRPECARTEQTAERRGGGAASVPWPVLDFRGAPAAEGGGSAAVHTMTVPSALPLARRIAVREWWWCC